MSHSDDLKDLPEETPAPEGVEKRPLGFEAEIAPADPSLTGRRLFLKLALAGTAAAMVPKTVLAALQDVAGTAPGTSEVPVNETPGTSLVPGSTQNSSLLLLPYSNSLAFQNQPASLSDGAGAVSNYSVNGGGNLYIDAGGNVFLSNVSATGTFVSGNLNAGAISVVQPAASLAGTYSGTTVNASTMVLFSDQDFQQQPATLTVAGTIGGGSAANLAMTVAFRPPPAQHKPDIIIEVGWSKTTC